MRAVNLLPRQQVEQKRERPNAVVLVAAIGGAAVVLALVAGTFVANRSVDRAAAGTRLRAGRARRDSGAPRSRRRHRPSARRCSTQREQRSLALASALGKRVAWDRVLRRFALVLPGDVWLTSLIGNRPARSGSRRHRRNDDARARCRRAATDLTIQGYTYTQAGVARLLERLAVVPDLKDVQLQNSTTTARLGDQTRRQLHDRREHPQRKGRRRDRPSRRACRQGGPGRARRGRCCCSSSSWATSP